MITTWYLHSHLTWDRLCHSCIGSSFLPLGAFPEAGAYALDGRMHAGSLEALRVSRPKAVDLERINRGPIDGDRTAMGTSLTTRCSLGRAISIHGCERPTNPDGETGCRET